MPEILLNDKTLIFKFEDNNEKIFLDLSNFYYNLGTIPFHSLDGKSLSVPSLIKSVCLKYERLVKNVDDPIDPLSTILTSIQVIKKAAQKYKPLSILEFGSSKGISYEILSVIINLCHPDSKLTCVSDPQYGNMLLKAFEIKNINVLLTRNYGILKDSFFDIVIINGSEFYDNPEIIIQNAIRTVNNGGTLICIPRKQYLLSSCFQVYFNDYEEFPVSNQEKVFIKNMDEKDKVNFVDCWEFEKIQNERLKNLYEMILPVLNKLCLASLGELETVIKQLHEMEQIAIELFGSSKDMELKMYINEVKENLLTFIYSNDDGQKKACSESCCRLYRNILTCI